MIIKDLKIREIYSHNLRKTVELEITTFKGTTRVSIPIGTSVGKNEAISLPAEKVIAKFLEIKKHFEMKDFKDVYEIDNKLKELDGTNNFSNIGANLALAISLGSLKAFALNEGLELYEYISNFFKTKIKIPKLVCNIIGGGKHGGNLDFQEFLLVGKSSETINEIEKIVSAYFEAADSLKEIDKNFTYARNVESAWVTYLDLKSVLNLMKKISQKYDLYLGIDFAASSLWNKEKEIYEYEKLGYKLSRTEQLLFIADLIEKYDLFYLEDPFHEEDFVTFSALTNRFSKKLIVGDDLICTNYERLERAIKLKSLNAVIIKPNQVGLISEVEKVVSLARKNDIKLVFSHRSGESEDTSIVHLAFGFGADYLKAGISGERTVKINEILRIAEKL